MKKLVGPLGPSTPVPKRRGPDAVEANRPHQWDGGGSGWLNAPPGGRTCRVCGVTERVDVVLADYTGFGDLGGVVAKGAPRVKTWVYTDLKGHTFASQRELGCPIFIMDPVGVSMENRAMIREVDDAVDNHEARLTRLEAENEELRAKLSERIDVTAMVEWLAEMVAQAAALKMQTVDVQIEGKVVAALPPPVVSLIVDVGAAASQMQREEVLVKSGRGTP